MKPFISAIVSVCITLTLIAIAWQVLFPVYDTNNDVAIRLYLEGRAIPGTEPSGYIYFLNLALGQSIAWLYRNAPGISWYDVIEQGTLALSAVIALHCCVRSIRAWDQAIIVFLMAATMLTVLTAIEFTVVGALGAIVGATALIVALISANSRLERLALSGAGALVLLSGTLIRLEAALFGLLIVALAGLYPVVAAFRHNLVRSKWTVAAFSFLVFGGVILAWAYHFAAYFSSADWKEFYQFNFLRARLTEYAASRLPQEILNRAFDAAGWSLADYELLTNWLFFDSNVFSTEKLSKTLSELPVLPQPSLLSVLNLLAEYGSKFPFFPFAVAGVILTASSVRRAVAALLSLLAIYLIVIAVSVLAKPLEYRVFWPVAVGIIFVTWVAIHADQKTLPHRLQRALAAALLGVACVLVLTNLVERSWAAERARQATLSDLYRLPLGPDDFMVIVESALPFEAVERPFAPPYLQRSIQAVPLGTLMRAPPAVQFVHRMALPEMPTWLCTDPVFIVASDSALRALQAYYKEHREQTVSFKSVFHGRTFDVYHCDIAK